MAADSDSALVVIDTNAVLDWLVFDHPSGRYLGAELTRGTLTWIATASMRDEFFHVLGRGALAAWNPDSAALHDSWNRHCRQSATPVVALTTPRCTDPDDQKFIDLAATHPGSLLLSRDRAVLKLAKRLARSGVRVMTPERWSADVRAVLTLSAAPSTTEPAC